MVLQLQVSLIFTIVSLCWYFSIFKKTHWFRINFFLEILKGKPFYKLIIGNTWSALQLGNVMNLNIKKHVSIFKAKSWRNFKNLANTNWSRKLTNFHIMFAVWVRLFFLQQKSNFVPENIEGRPEFPWNVSAFFLLSFFVTTFLSLCVRSQATSNLLKVVARFPNLLAEIKVFFT